MRRIKDFFYNSALNVRLWLWFRFQFKIKRFFIVGGEHGNANTLYPTPESAMIEWQDGMPWGRIHPDYDHQVMTGNSVMEKKFTDGKRKELHLMHLPFQKIGEMNPFTDNGKVYFPLIDSGCVYYRQPFKYGIFQLTCILPESSSAWPAFWTYGKESWPPEIDWFEFMPNSQNKKGHYKLSTNLHSGSEKKHKQKTHAFRLSHNKVGKPITITGVWTPKAILFYYEGILVRRTTHKDSVASMNGEQWLVLGTGGMSDYNDDIFDTSFIIKEVLYKPLG